MKKILIIASHANSLIGFRQQLLLDFQKSGLDVHVAAPDITDEQDVIDKLKEFGISYHNISMKRASISPLNNINSLLSLYRLIAKIKPDITFSYTAKPVIYGLIASWIAKVPVKVALITGLGYAFQDTNKSLKRKFTSFFSKKLYAFALRRSSLTFFQNSDDRNLFLSLKLLKKNSHNLVINGSGIDLNEYPVTTPQLNPIRFLFVGRLLKDKGIIEFIKASLEIKEKYPAIEVDILGDIDKNPASLSKDEILKWKESKLINFLGWSKDVKPFLQRSSVFILPSYREGTPRSTLEAMSMGKPIITTNAPGCKETVENNINGFLVPIKDTKSLVTSMERFIKNPELIKTMGIQSRRIAEEKYDVTKVNKSMLQAMGIIQNDDL